MSDVMDDLRECPFDIRQALTDLCEAVHEDKLYGTSTPSGKPYDPDISISEMRDKIITAWNTRADTGRIKVLENALRFYADGSRYNTPLYGETELNNLHMPWPDEGHKARQALEKS